MATSVNALRFPVFNILSDLLKNGKGSDFIISCNGEIFNVHKLIIGSQGGYFALILSPGFREAQTGECLLDDHDPRVVEAVVQFLYGIPYSVPRIGAAAVFHAKVYNAGEYFQLPVLKQNSLHHFKALRKTGNIEIMKPCIDAAKIIYEGTPETDTDMRAELRKTIEAHYDALFVNDETMVKALSHAPQLVVDLLAGPTYMDVCWKCPDCKGQFGARNNSDKRGKKVRNEASVQCRFCHFVYTSAQLMREHDQTATA